MFPLKTLPDAAKTPHLTRIFVLMNVVAFGAQWFWSVRGVDVSLALGVVPQRLVDEHIWAEAIVNQTPHPALFSPIYALFLHGDALHLGFNLLFLWIFGTALESELGRVRWLLLYFGGGFAATLAHVLTHLGSNVPVIGASGAVAALLGAYFVRLPRAWVLTYFPPIWILPVPAPLFLLLWFGAQVSGALDAGLGLKTAASGVAWMAHLGGFAGGALYGWRTRPRRKAASIQAAPKRAKKARVAESDSAAIVRK